MLTVYQGSNLFKKRHQNTRLLALSIVLFAILQFSPSGFAFAFVGFNRSGPMWFGWFLGNNNDTFDTFIKTRTK